MADSFPDGSLNGKNSHSFYSEDGNRSFSRHEFVRLLESCLVGMGYEKTAKTLEEESKISCISTKVSLLLASISSGRWDESHSLVSSLDFGPGLSYIASLAINECRFLEAARNGHIQDALDILHDMFREFTLHVPDQENLAAMKRRVNALATTVFLDPVSTGSSEDLARTGEEPTRCDEFLSGPLLCARSVLLEAIRGQISKMEIPELGRLENLILRGLYPEDNSALGKTSLLQDWTFTTPSLKASFKPFVILDLASEVWCVHYSIDGKFLAALTNMSEIHLFRFDDSQRLVTQIGRCIPPLGFEAAEHIQDFVWSPNSSEILGICNTSSCVYSWCLKDVINESASGSNNVLLLSDPAVYRIPTDSAVQCAAYVPGIANCNEYYIFIGTSQSQIILLDSSGAIRRSFDLSRDRATQKVNLVEDEPLAGSSQGNARNGNSTREKHSNKFLSVSQLVYIWRNQEEPAAPGVSALKHGQRPDFATQRSSGWQARAPRGIDSDHSDGIDECKRKACTPLANSSSVDICVVSGGDTLVYVAFTGPHKKQDSISFTHSNVVADSLKLDQTIISLACNVHLKGPAVAVASLLGGDIAVLNLQQRKIELTHVLSGQLQHRSILRPSICGHWHFSRARKEAVIMIAAGCEDGRVVTRSLAEPGNQHVLDSHLGPVGCVCWSPLNADSLVSVSDDNTLIIWKK
jgi:WD40 repeat protein